MSTEERKAFWSQHLMTWKSSGQTAKKYCEENSIDATMFSKWKRRLYYQANRQKKEKTSFSKVKVDLSTSHTVDKSVRIELIFPNGIKLSSSAWPPAEILKSYREVLA